ncbi:hypothetical protein EV421DRAFT_542183 [Armillaria borealis]|uniref:Uncharacterized protein n=1 Tax=Armillaria borealis TaxID=47425 RepID=A0AA39JIV2_9AGAR|nr:hypothetical protein EV421DRAFT_542183 [Armillaria borealis]
MRASPRIHCLNITTLSSTFHPYQAVASPRPRKKALVLVNVVPCACSRGHRRRPAVKQSQRLRRFTLNVPHEVSLLRETYATVRSQRYEPSWPQHMACHVRAVDPAVPDWDLAPVHTPHHTPSGPLPATLSLSTKGKIFISARFISNGRRIPWLVADRTRTDVAAACSFLYVRAFKKTPIFIRPCFNCAISPGMNEGDR